MRPKQLEDIIRVRNNAITSDRDETKVTEDLKTKAAKRELPQKRVTAHILRHTYITRLFEAGLDIKGIQYLAGYSTPKMTMRIYTHYD